MRSHISFLATIATFIAALAGASSVAHAGGDERAPAPTSRTGSASAWRSIAYDDALTTARCVGDPRTPVCAVETVYGCFVRGGEMCRNIIADADFAEVFAQRGHSNDVIYFRVLRLRHSHPQDRLFHPRFDVDEFLRPRTTDVIVTVHRRICRLPGPTCERGKPLTMHFLMRRFGSHWKMISGTSERLD